MLTVRFRQCSSLFAGLLFSLWSAMAQQPASAPEMVGKWTIQYHTNMVTVVKVEQSGEPVNAPFTSVTVRNISGRPITALMLAFGRSVTPHSFQPELKPGGTETWGFNLPQAGADWVMRIKAVLFGDGEAAGDGDPNDVEWMRFHRLGVALEDTSCEAKARSLDPARLDDATLNAMIGSVWSLQDSLWQDQSAHPLETVLASFSDSPLKTKLQGASQRAKGAFLMGVSESSDLCRFSLQQLLQEPNVPSGSESSRARSLSNLLTQSQASLRLLQTIVETDMGVAR
jgi:hypothetical protein